MPNCQYIFNIILYRTQILKYMQKHGPLEKNYMVPLVWKCPPPWLRKKNEGQKE